MTTEANLTLFMLILLICASAAGNPTPPSTSSSFSNTSTTDTEVLDNTTNPTEGGNQGTMTTAKFSSSSSSLSPSSPSPSSPSIMISHSQTSVSLDQPTTFSRTTTTPHESKAPTRLMIFGIVLAILVLVVLGGCCYGMKDKESEDRCVPRLLLGARRRMRAAVGTLENRMGVPLWPGTKREGGDDDEAEGVPADEANRRARNQEEEDSDDSSGSSSICGCNLDMDNLADRQEEVEGRKQSGQEEEEETSSDSEGGASVGGGGEKRGGEKGSLEEIVLVKAAEGDDKAADALEVSVL